jgi:hypothetical protein
MTARVTVLAVLNKKALLYAKLPKRSLVVHGMECWEASARDVEPWRFSRQLWRLNTQVAMPQQDPDFCANGDGMTFILNPRMWYTLMLSFHC